MPGKQTPGTKLPASTRKGRALGDITNLAKPPARARQLKQQTGRASPKQLQQVHADICAQHTACTLRGHTYCALDPEPGDCKATAAPTTG